MARSLLLALCTAPLCAQEHTLDLFDGETLYERGTLITLAYELTYFEDLLSGDARVDDPLHASRRDHVVAVAAHHGLRHDLQLSAIFPYVYRELEVEDPAGPDRFATDGPGDATVIAKWRFHRWDAPHQALNVAAIAGLELPTGLHRERDHGVRLPAELQPGSGSWDPMGGLAATYEPGRWRFNSFALYKYNSENRDDYRFGEEVFAEIAAGNRFWLEPYPGPFMRLDVMLRWRHRERDRLDGHRVRNSGGDLLFAGANLAFRPRPELDFQVEVEFPLYRYVRGTQLVENLSASFNFGYRF